MGAVVGTIRSTYSVIFVRQPSSAFSYAVKIFPLTTAGRRDYVKESSRHSMVSESHYVAKAIECVEYNSGMVPVVPLGVGGPL